jgi:GNAT superfamily N-acetyltransferase
MVTLRRLLDVFRPSDRVSNAVHAREIAPIPPVVATRLIPDNYDDPLFPKLKRFGRGEPGVERVADEWWVIRDHRGVVVGGAMVGSIGDDHPVAIDVAVEPSRQGHGLGTTLYSELERAGVDVESASEASLAHGTMTPLGYVFMRSRRSRHDPDAEATICASASICPGCGPLSI